MSTEPLSADAAGQAARFLHHHPDAFFALDTDGHLLLWNREAERLLLRDAEELPGGDLEFALTEAVCALIAAECRRALQDRQALVWDLFHPGLKLWLEIHAVPVPEGLAVYCRDITAHKQAAARLATVYEQEHQIAEKLQRSMLMLRPETQFPSLGLEAFYEAAWEDGLVGGDFLDTFTLLGGKIALVVGDITGKGLTAAAYIAEVKFSLRAFLREYASPAMALFRLNAFLWQGLDDGTLAGVDITDPFAFDRLACLTLAVLDPQTGEIVCSAAGMEPPLILRHNGEAEQIRVSGRPLGVLAREEYTPATLRLEPGEIMLMASDGITEARRRNFFFGVEGMAQAAKQAWPGGSLKEVGQVVLNQARAYAGGRFRDDACLLVACWQPECAPPLVSAD